MREILFRGKDIDTGKWRYGGYSVIEPPPVCFTSDLTSRDKPKSCIVVEVGFADWGMPRSYGMAEVDADTVGQYTGLLDKNGTKIFEGDILEVKNTFVDTEKDTHGFLIVSFLDDAFCAGDKPLSYWLFGSRNGNRTLERAEVCGNIYDNPELLEENSNG